MLIRCWGSRGSIAVCGKEYIKYGGDTTCIEVVSASGDIVIIDAGTGIRRLGTKLVNDGTLKVNIILTHPHWDHLAGFPFFKLLYDKKSEIHVRGPRTTQDSIRSIISRTMAPPYFPVDLDNIHANIKFHATGEEGFDIGSVHIKTIPLNHTNVGVGYRLEEDGKSFVFLTDNELKHRHENGLKFIDYVKFSNGADVLFHDSEYTTEDYKEGWGHSVCYDSLELALKAGVKKLGLFHHNQDRTDDEIDHIEKNCRTIIAEKGSKMKCLAVAVGTEIQL